MSITSWLDPRLIGEAILIVIAAIVIGYVVRMVWPKRQNPDLFATLAAVGFVAGLAYAGFASAAIAAVLVLVIGVAMVSLGLVG
ncbi:MAG: hypothetical protein AAFR70_10405 [Pseudomonadota bacterium]